MTVTDSIRALVGFGRTLDTIANTDDALRVALAQAMALTQADAGLVAWAPEAGAPFVHASGLDPARIDAFSAAFEAEPDAAFDLRLVPDDCDDVVAVPLSDGTRGRGRLLLAYRRPLVADGPEAPLLSALADRASSHLAHRASVARAERHGWLDAVGLVLASATDSAAMFDGLAPLLLPRLGDRTLIELFDGDAGVERRVFATTPEEFSAASRAIAELSSAPPAQRPPDSEPPGIQSFPNDATNPDPAFASVAAALGAHAAVRAPITSGGRWLGTLTIGSTTAKQVPTDVAALVAEVANRIGLARARLVRTAATGTRREASEAFVAIASHELRTPLTVLRIAVERLGRLAQREDVSPAFAETLRQGVDRALLQCDRVVGMSDRLVDAALIESGTFAVAVEDDVDLAALVRKASARLLPDLQHAGCTLQLTGPERLVGRWDPARLENVLSNLLSNAARHAPGAAVEVSLAGDEHIVAWTVRDHGPGLSPVRLAQAFARFDRHGDASEGSGWGLGLFLSRHIVEAHGGTIHARNAPDGGLALVIELPREASAATPRAA